mmetsp:Transcript_48071/g.145178  ORF Transcript_48071/g.145178 Transcript_48071/m.145178 type:complete len:92 (+) Transcript_48071:123-398(+)|eukprot:CAMPEP_0113525700 /NCGR_PEP_ID=MMETSP0015_2-20120614/316_1 /TAXON_ID=2838 /ORGANISM="Odontella" /LENGTH=91 /DNA_ID=CAMNT_0000423913 /DNA_START=39 /DNA_END=314 /DNA_ORIENTATION=+ /assembly_acc=CAM_ASM_000160
MASLMTAPGWKVGVWMSPSEDKDENGGSEGKGMPREDMNSAKGKEALRREREGFVRIYLHGQKEVLEELQSDLSEMMRQSEGEDKDSLDNE